MRQNMTQDEIMLGNAAFSSKLNVIHHAHVDICGDLLAGVLLSQILYWFGADRNGKPRARIHKDGHLWIAKSRADWWDEIRITPKQYDRAVKILQGKQFVELRTMKFNGNPTTHIRIKPEHLNKAIDEWKYQQAAYAMADSAHDRMAVGYSPLGNNEMHQRGTTILPESQYLYNPMGNNDVSQMGISITETTAENTNENTAENTHTQRGEREPLTFDNIWSHYPKKVGRSKAHKAYVEALAQGANPYAVLVETVLFSQYIACTQEKEGIQWRYVPTGGVWFDEQRWNDETQLIGKHLGFDEAADYNRRVSEMKRLAKVAHATESMGERNGILKRINGLIELMPY